MKLMRNIAVVAAAMAFGAVPAVAIASGGGNSNSAPGHNKTTSSSSTSSTSSTKAYGRICAAKGESTKKHAPDQPTGKTPFAQCVVALAQANKNAKMTAREACAALSKKHVKSTTNKTKGTPFSECVSAVKNLRHP